MVILVDCSFSLEGFVRVFSCYAHNPILPDFSSTIDIKRRGKLSYW